MSLPVLDNLRFQMSKHHNKPVPAPAPVKDEIKTVKVLSQRPGDIVVKVGNEVITIKYNQVVDLPLDVATKMAATNDGLVRIL